MSDRQQMTRTESIVWTAVVGAVFVAGVVGLGFLAGVMGVMLGVSLFFFGALFGATLDG